MFGLLIDAAVIAGLIHLFARYNANGGMLYAFLMLLAVTAATIVAIVAIPESLHVLILPIYLLLLAVGLTVICGTQPRQTAKIIGCFLLFRLAFFGLALAIG